MLPDNRLSAAAELVRQGAVFADIGTDHAILPVFLCKIGRVKRAVAADINEGPLETARKTVETAGLSDRISLRLTDGLTGLEDEGLTDVAICGMGGELIVSILKNAPFVKNEGIRLILQPMTHAADLRRYLASEGFLIEEERLSRASGRVYFCLAASYTGRPYEISRVEAELGRHNAERAGADPLVDEMLLRLCRSSEKKCRGLTASGTCNEEEKEYLSALYALLGRKQV